MGRGGVSMTRLDAIQFAQAENKFIQQQYLDLMITEDEAKEQRQQVINLLLQSIIKRN
jgi:hypothetical protein